MTLGVVSLLARMGVDPWSEAGRLATLPKDAAEGSSPRQSPAPQKARTADRGRQGGRDPIHGQSPGQPKLRSRTSLAHSSNSAPSPRAATKPPGTRSRSSTWLAPSSGSV